MKEAIVIVHGLFMNSLVMKPMEIYFKKRGYDVYSYNYPTTSFEKKEAILEFRRFILRIKNRKIHFVGHSMGGLLIRLYLEKHKSKKYGRVVTIATPHNTSSVARKVKSMAIGFVLGKAGNFVLTEKLPEWDEHFEIGCIIGTLNVGPLNVICPHESEGDGTVTIEESVLENSNDEIRLNINHTGLIYSKNCYKQVIAFLKEGKFKTKV